MTPEIALAFAATFFGVAIGIVIGALISLHHLKRYRDESR